MKGNLAMKYFVLCLLFFFSFNMLSAKNSDAKPGTRVLLKTSMGDIVVMLYNETERHRDNFVKLVEDGFYDGLLFHRIISDFMIQGGDPESKDAAKDKRLGSGGPGYTIPAEILPKYFHKKGALSAARIGDQVNPARRSSGSQFYIVTGKRYSREDLDLFERRMNTKFDEEQRKAYETVGGTPHLDGQYSVFGEVIKGMDVVDKIEKVKTGNQDRPVEDVKIIKAEIMK